MEYDVRFTGNWNYFFDAFEQSASDLLATTLYRHELRPAWHLYCGAERDAAVAKAQHSLSPDKRLRRCPK